MKKTIIVFVMFCGLIASSFQPTDNPQAEISNGIIKAHLYLPDTQDGYYQGTRFDWSGIIFSLEYMGHNYFGQWFKEYSRTNHDAIMGPAEAFSPLNYGEADSGGVFVQIGVGAMTKPSDERHGSFNTYPIVDPGMWKIKKKAEALAKDPLLFRIRIDAININGIAGERKVIGMYYATIDSRLLLNSNPFFLRRN